MKKTIAGLTARPEPQQPETAQSVINPDIVRYTRLLGDIADWFTDYGKHFSPADDHVRERLIEIDNHLVEAANNIAELVAIEFLQNAFYQEIAYYNKA